MNFNRRILLAITGLSPQVLSETLYGLSVDRAPLEIPNEIHVITTGTGERRLRAVLGTQEEILESLSRERGLPPFRLPTSNVHVLRSADGTILEDITTSTDNLAYADAVTSLVREFTTDAAAQLHVSVAGGRKTMGFLLGYVFTLFARPQDRMSHVLVNHPYESLPDFLYPTAGPSWLQARDGTRVNAQDAVVNLVDIPYVSLRPGLPSALLAGRASYEQVVAGARRSLEAPRLVLRLSQRQVTAAGVTFSLAPLEMALYALLARRARSSAQPLMSPEHRDAYKDWAHLISQELKQMRKIPVARTEGRFSVDTEEARLELRKRVYENLSRLKRRLSEALGSDAPAYLVFDGNKRPRCYSLRLPPGAIEIC
jgi:CRISPR-associated protein (TIGR02584 family)